MGEVDSAEKLCKEIRALADELKKIPSAASDCYRISEDVPDICPECLDRVVLWLDSMGGEISEAAKNLSDDEQWMRPELVSIIQHFTFVATRIRIGALR
jgi:hypothetical protein